MQVEPAVVSVMVEGEGLLKIGPAGGEEVGETLEKMGVMVESEARSHSEKEGEELIDEVPPEPKKSEEEEKHHEEEQTEEKHEVHKHVKEEEEGLTGKRIIEDENMVSYIELEDGANEEAIKERLAREAHHDKQLRGLATPEVISE